MTSREKFLEWTAALDSRHLSELTVTEVRFNTGVTADAFKK